MPDGVVLREATGAGSDSALVARLHASSWRSAYRDILDPAWLAGELDADRAAVWRARLDSPAPAPDLHLLIAESDGDPLGFVCAMGGRDARWGTLVDNLHVLPQAKGGGIGAMLLRAAAAWTTRTFPDAGLHLLCYAENRAARGFYDHMGGRVVEQSDRIAPDGRIAPELRYHWDDVAKLAG